MKKLKKTMSRVDILLNKQKKVFIIITILFNLFLILFFSSPPDHFLLILMIAWIFLGIEYKISEKIFFIAALFFLIATPLPLILKNQILANRMAVWEFIYIIIGLLIYWSNEGFNYFFNKKSKVKKT